MEVCGGDGLSFAIFSLDTVVEVSRVVEMPGLEPGEMQDSAPGVESSIGLCMPVVEDLCSFVFEGKAHIRIGFFPLTGSIIATKNRTFEHGQSRTPFLFGRW